MDPGIHMMNIGVDAKLLTFMFNIYIYKQMSLPPSLLDWDDSVIDLITSAWLTG